MNVPIDVLCKTPKTKAHSEKSMNVSDVQVSDEDGYLSRNMTIRANLNDDSQFANKIAKERIWTLTSRFGSKQQDRERTNLDQSGHQQDYETAFGIRH